MFCQKSVSLIGPSMREPSQGVAPENVRGRCDTGRMSSVASPLERFGPATRAWFEEAFPEGPTPAQTGAWEAISGGRNTLVVAPTGSGRTLSAFLWSLD